MKQTNKDYEGLLTETELIDAELQSIEENLRIIDVSLLSLGISIDRNEAVHRDQFRIELRQALVAYANVEEDEQKERLGATISQLNLSVLNSERNLRHVGSNTERGVSLGRIKEEYADRIEGLYVRRAQVLAVRAKI